MLEALKLQLWVAWGILKSRDNIMQRLWVLFRPAEVPRVDVVITKALAFLSAVILGTMNRLRP